MANDKELSEYMGIKKEAFYRELTLVVWGRRDEKDRWIISCYPTPYMKLPATSK